MSRVLGCGASEAGPLRHELLEATNPVGRPPGGPDPGWGTAVYPHAEGEEPRCVRFAEAAFSNEELRTASEERGRIFNVRVRRATIGGLALENTHPFCMGSYSFSHNGTVIQFQKLLGADVSGPRGTS